MLSVDVEELFAYHLVVDNGRLSLPPKKAYELGIEQGRRKIVLKLLDKFPPDQVAELSGVSLDKVKAMQEGSKSLD